ncbi:unnamed protein product, partial [Bubo scandiacus]
MAEAPRVSPCGDPGLRPVGAVPGGAAAGSGPPPGPGSGLCLGAGTGGGWRRCPPPLRLLDLRLLPQTEVDLVVEVAHPCVAREHGEDILAYADFMLGSPTALADPETERRLRGAAARGGHTLYVPRGGPVGLRGHSAHGRVWDAGRAEGDDDEGPAELPPGGVAAGAAGGGGWRRGNGRCSTRVPCVPSVPSPPTTSTPWRPLPWPPPRLGFDGVCARLVADPSVPDWHIVEVEGDECGGTRDGPCMSPAPAATRRRGALSPAMPPRHVFWSSLRACTGTRRMRPAVL